MFHDLNLSLSVDSRTQRRDVVETARRLGYRTVVINVEVDKVVDELRPDPQVLLGWGKREEQGKAGRDREGKRLLVAGGERDDGESLRPRIRIGSGTAEGRGENGDTGGSGVDILWRITVNVTNALQIPSIRATEHILRRFDIVAVAPATEKLLEMCLEIDHLDIVAVDIGSSARLPLLFRAPNVATMKRRGVMVEICYAGVLRDANTRRCVITNAIAIVRLTNGTPIVLSSGAKNLIELRGARDVINLAATLFRLPSEKSRRALGTNPSKVLLRAQTSVHPPPIARILRSASEDTPVTSGDATNSTFEPREAKDSTPVRIPSKRKDDGQPRPQKSKKRRP